MNVERGKWLEDGISMKIDSLFRFLEKDRMPLFLMFIYIIVIALIRDLSEYFLLDREFVTTSHPWIFSIAHHVSFYAVVFLGLVFLLSAFSGSTVRRVVNFASTFWWVIILPPFIDHCIGGLTHNYEYFSPTDFVDALLHFSGKGFHIGQATEVVFILFCVFSYAIWYQRHDLHTVRGRITSFLRVGFLVFFTLASMFILATPALFLPVGSHGGIPVFPAFDLTKYHQYHLFLVAYYVLLGIAVFYSILYLATKRNFVNILRSMRLPQTLFFIILVAAGIVVSWSNSSEIDLIASIFQTPYWVNVPFIVLSAVSAILAWQVSTMWNDISDVDTDEPGERRILVKGLISINSWFHLSLILASTSLCIAALLCFEQVLILLIIYGLAMIYSFRPFRLKKHLLRPLLMGLGTFLAFLYGSFTPYTEILQFAGDPPVPYLTGSVIIPFLTPEVLLVGFCCFAGLVIGSMVMDIEGYREDLRGDVKTVFTVLGLERGKRAVSGLIFAASLLPLLLFHKPMDIVFPVLGITAAVLFNITSSPRPVMVLSLIGLLYAALRYLGFL